MVPRPLRRARPASLATLAGALLLLAGCAGITPIGELLDNPAKYDGKTVSVEGEVKESAGGLGLGAYQVKDDTGTLITFLPDGSVETTGPHEVWANGLESLICPHADRGERDGRPAAHRLEDQRQGSIRVADHARLQEPGRPARGDPQGALSARRRRAAPPARTVRAA